MSYSATDDTSAGDESITHEADDWQGSISANSRPLRRFNLHESYAPTATYSPGMGSFDGYRLYPLTNASPFTNDTNVSDPHAGLDFRVPLEEIEERRVFLVPAPRTGLDYPVPSPIRNAVQSKYKDMEGDTGEFTNLRYTAVTCDPNDFTLKNGYDLRPRMYNRATELMINITYYNEDKMLMSKTTHAVMQQIRDIYNLRGSTFWNRGGPSWQKIVLCIVMDGIEVCDSQVLDVLATVGVYQHHIAKSDLNGPEVEAHVFEYTTQLSVTHDQYLIRPMDDSPSTLPPLQVILCIKQRNSGKINSMRWIYNAFGRILNPEVIQHIDAGTMPHRNSILRLWEAFFNDKNLGGACGTIYPMLRKGVRSLLNPLVACQNFEYIVSIQLLGALESSTGYVSVLPGAFSAYRFRAVMGAPLEAYFHGDPTLEKMLGDKSAASTIWRLNRYLADDRILSWELVIKAGSKWHCKAITEVKAETDVPESVVDFINQRRRWLNGALFASVYTLWTSPRMFRSGHNWIRLFFLLLQLAHNLVSVVLAWFSLAGFLLTTFVVNDITGDPPDDAPVDGFPFGSATPVVNGVLQVIYLLTVAFQFILALGSRPRGAVLYYITSISIFTVVQLYLFINLIYLTKRLIDFKLDTNGASSYAYIGEYYTDVGSSTILVTAVAMFGTYIGAGILCRNPKHLLTSWGQYLFISSSYVNILKTYAFSNIHDGTWGQKSGKEVYIAIPIPTTTEPQVPTETQTPGYEYGIDRPQVDIDTEFEATVKQALAPFEETTTKTLEETREEAFMKFRVIMVSVYLFSNFFLCILILNDSFKSLSFTGDSYWHKVWFFKIWMWGNSGLLLLQFAGRCYVSLWTWSTCMFQRR